MENSVTSCHARCNETRDKPNGPETVFIKYHIQTKLMFQKGEFYIILVRRKSGNRGWDFLREAFEGTEVESGRCLIGMACASGAVETRTDPRPVLSIRQASLTRVAVR